MRPPPLPDSSSLLRFPDALAASPAGRIEWRQALKQYLRARPGKSPFSKPRLQTPGVPVLDVPVRLRTIGGGEVDRIGDRCYAVPAVDSLPEMSADPGHARYMQAMQPLFAHEVPCGSVPDSMGESFLKALRRLVDGPP